MLAADELDDVEQASTAPREGHEREGRARRIARHDDERQGAARGADGLKPGVGECEGLIWRGAGGPLRARPSRAPLRQVKRKRRRARRRPRRSGLARLASRPAGARALRRGRWQWAIVRSRLQPGSFSPRFLKERLGVALVAPRKAFRKDCALRFADDDHDHAECAHQRGLRRISRQRPASPGARSYARARRHPDVSSRAPVARPTPGYAPNACLKSRRNFSISRLASSRGKVSSSSRSTRRAGVSPAEARAVRRADLRRRLSRHAGTRAAGAGAPPRRFTVFSPRLRRGQRATVVARARGGDAPLGRGRVLVAGQRLGLPRATPREKTAAYERIYWLMRARPEAELLDAVARSRAPRRGRRANGLLRAVHGLERAHGLKPPSARNRSARMASPHRRLAHLAAAEAQDRDGRLEGAARGAPRREGQPSPIRSETRRAWAIASSSSRARSASRRRSPPAGDAVFRARRALDRVAARLHQRALAGSRGARDPADRRAVLAVESRPAGRRVTLQALAGSP